MNSELKGRVFTCNCAHSLLYNSFIFTFLKMDRNRVSLTSFAVSMATIVDTKPISIYNSFLVVFKMCPQSKFFPYQFWCK